MSQMKALGASEVVTEEFAASHKMKDLVAVRSYSNIVHHILNLFATIFAIRDYIRHSHLKQMKALKC